MAAASHADNMMGARHAADKIMSYLELMSITVLLTRQFP